MRTVTVYHVQFRPPQGGSYRLDTPDPAKIGPWVADMFSLHPWHQSWPDQPIVATTTELHVAP